MIQFIYENQLMDPYSQEKYQGKVQVHEIRKAHAYLNLQTVVYISILGFSNYQFAKGTYDYSKLYVETDLNWK